MITAANLLIILDTRLCAISQAKEVGTVAMHSEVAGTRHHDA